MECLRIGSLVEIEITSEYLIGPLAAQYHLDTHAADHAGKEVHGSAGAHRGNIICFNEINHVSYSIQPLLYRIVDFMVYCTYVVGNLAGLCQVGSTLQAYCKRVQTRPPGLLLVIGLYATCGVFLGNGRYHRTVQTT